jgi:hypothetical protein
MDQPTATVITTSITAIITLTAAFGGIAINNRNTVKKEKRDKIRAAVEETVQVILKIDNVLNTSYNNVSSGIVASREELLEESRRIADHSLRIGVLVRLYIRNLNALQEAHTKNMVAYWNTTIDYNWLIVRGDASPERVEEKSQEAQLVYKKSLSEILDKLEKFIE